MKISFAVAMLTQTHGLKMENLRHHKHHHKRLNYNLSQAELESIPACNSYTFPKCVTDAETIAPEKLQADQDYHDKDYFVPNFGLDHDIITTQANIANAEKAIKHPWDLSLV